MEKRKREKKGRSKGVEEERRKDVKRIFSDPNKFPDPKFVSDPNFFLSSLP